MKTIDITPTWQSLIDTLVVLVSHGDAQGRAKGRSELLRLAKVVDDFNARTPHDALVETYQRFCKEQGMRCISIDEHDREKLSIVQRECLQVFVSLFDHLDHLSVVAAANSVPVVRIDCKNDLAQSPKE